MKNLNSEEPEINVFPAGDCLMKQGAGIWLNPKTKKWRYVTKHELFLYYRSDDARELGVPDSVLEKISDMNVIKDETPIRIEAIKAGMVRMRDKWTEVIAQFYADQGVRDVLWAIYHAMNDVPDYRNAWHIKVDNLHPELRDNIRLEVKEFERRLKEGESIIREDVAANITQPVSKG